MRRRVSLWRGVPLIDKADPEDSWRYRYDALGRRVKKLAEDGSETHWYFYDGERVILELVDDGEETFVRGEYVYGVGLDEVILEWLDDGGTEEPFWPMVDSLGTVRDLGEPYGGGAQVRMAYRYSPWGEVLEEAAVGGDAVYQDVLFTARWLDRETRNADSPGLYHYRAREYAPELGRFLQRDPIGVWGDGMNLGNGYGYVGGDPIGEIDPLGVETVYMRGRWADEGGTSSRGTLFCAEFMRYSDADGCPRCSMLVYSADYEERWRQSRKVEVFAIVDKEGIRLLAEILGTSVEAELDVSGTLSDEAFKEELVSNRLNAAGIVASAIPVGGKVGQVVGGLIQAASVAVEEHAEALSYHASKRQNAAIALQGESL